MPEPIREVLVKVLQACHERGTKGFYPRLDAATLNLERGTVDEGLDFLRLGGFIEITDWVQDKGQGYRLTPLGENALGDPALLTRPPTPKPANPATNDGSHWERGEAVRNSLLSPEPARVSPVIVALYIASFVGIGVWVVQLGTPFFGYFWSASGPRPGALIPYAFFVQGEWWRLLTYSWVHGGLVHLLMNTMALANLAPVLESMWGLKRFLALYLGSGVLAGCAVLLFDQPNTATIGASGAIAGLLTSLGVWAWLFREHLPANFLEAHLRKVLWSFVALVLIGFMPNVSMTCHMGGAAAGAILTIPLAWMASTSPRRHRLMGLAALALLGLATWYLVDVIAARPLAFDCVRYQSQQAERRLETIFLDDAEPILRNGLADNATERIAAVRPRLQEGQTQALRTATWLGRMKSSLTSDHVPVVDTLIELFQRRETFFRTLLDDLTNPKDLTEVRRQAVARTWPPAVFPPESR